MSRRPYTKRRLRSEYLRFMRRNAWSFAAVCLLLALAASTSWLLRGNSFEKGFVVGVLACAAVAMTIIAFLSSGGGVFSYVGALGEDLTREELKRATKKGWLWGWVDNLESASGDIDHVVLAPRGAIAVETKFHFDRKRNLDKLRSDAEGALTRAAQLRSILRSVELKEAVEVLPLLVIWGPMESTLDGARELSGVTVLPGRELRTYLRGVQTGLVSEDNAERLLNKLRGFRERVQPTSSASRVPRA